MEKPIRYLAYFIATHLHVCIPWPRADWAGGRCNHQRKPSVARAQYPRRGLSKLTTCTPAERHRWRRYVAPKCNTAEEVATINVWGPHREPPERGCWRRPEDVRCISMQNLEASDVYESGLACMHYYIRPSLLSFASTATEAGAIRPFWAHRQFPVRRGIIQAPRSYQLFRLGRQLGLVHLVCREIWNGTHAGKERTALAISNLAEAVPGPLQRGEELWA